MGLVELIYWKEDKMLRIITDGAADMPEGWGEEYDSFDLGGRQSWTWHGRSGCLSSGRVTIWK